MSDPADRANPVGPLSSPDGPLSLEALASPVDLLDAVLVFHLSDAHLHAVWVRPEGGLRAEDIVTTLRDLYRVGQFAAKRLGALASSPGPAPPAPVLTLELDHRTAILRKVRAHAVACVFDAAMPLGMARLIGERVTSALAPELPLEAEEDGRKRLREAFSSGEAARNLPPSPESPRHRPADAWDPPAAARRDGEPGKGSPEEHPRAEVGHAGGEPPNARSGYPVGGDAPNARSGLSTLRVLPEEQSPSTLSFGASGADPTASKPEEPELRAPSEPAGASVSATPPPRALSEHAALRLPRRTRPPPSISDRVTRLVAHLEANAPEPHVVRLRLALRAGLTLGALDKPELLGPEAVVLVETAVQDILGIDRAELRRIA